MCACSCYHGATASCLTALWHLALAAPQRFDFYYERFANHLDSRMQAQKQQETMGPKLEPLLAAPELVKALDNYQRWASVP